MRASVTGKGTWAGSYSADQGISHWKGHLGEVLLCIQCVRHLTASLSIVQLPMLACGEGKAMEMAPPPCFQDCLAFLHRHFPPQPPPSHPLYLSLGSQQQPSSWNCSTIPKLQLLATMRSREPASLSGGCMAAARTVWFSFHSGCRRSAASRSALNVSPPTQTVAPLLGLDPCFSPPHPLKAGPVLWTFPFRHLHPRPFLPSVTWFYTLFPLVRSSCLLWTGVLHALLSEGVFLMYLWREMDSSTILVPTFFKLFFIAPK